MPPWAAAFVGRIPRRGFGCQIPGGTLFVESSATVRPAISYTARRTAGDVYAALCANGTGYTLLQKHHALRKRLPTRFQHVHIHTACPVQGIKADFVDSSWPKIIYQSRHLLSKHVVHEKANLCRLWLGPADRCRWIKRIGIVLFQRECCGQLLVFRSHSIVLRCGYSKRNVCLI